MTRPDDLQKGQYITVIGSWKECDCDECFWKITCGIPYLVLSVSFPFICVFDGDDAFAIDIREWQVQKMSDEYAEMMGWVNTKKQKKRNQQGLHNAPVQSDLNMCPRCGEKMIEKRIIKRGQHAQWVKTCPNCGLDGRLVKVG